MSVAALVLSLAVAAKLSPAPTAPSSRKSSEWSAYNKARAEAGLLPRKAARGTTQVSPSLVRDPPSTATALDAAPPVRVVEEGEPPRAAPAPMVAVEPAVPAAPPGPAPAAPVPARAPMLAVEEPPPLRRPTPSQRQVLEAVRRASVGAAVERSARAAVIVTGPDEPAAAAEPAASSPVVAAAAPAPTPAAAAAPASAPAPVEPARAAFAERSRTVGVRLDAEGGSLLAGLRDAKVALRVVAREGRMTLAVDRPEVALR